MDKYIDKIDLSIISNQNLAFIGDSVYDLYIRSYLLSIKNSNTKIIHNDTIRYVSAKAQSYIIDNLVELLKEEELSIYKRGRNTNINNVSKNVDIVSYKKATGFECLIGYFYLSKDLSRLEEIIEYSIDIINKKYMTK